MKCRNLIPFVLLLLLLSLPFLLLAVSPTQMSSPTKYLLNQIRLSAAMYDFDVNGYNDLATISGSGVQVYRGNSNGVFTLATTNTVTNAISLVLSDLNGAVNFNGWDIIAGCQSNQSKFIAVLLKSSSLTFASAIYTAVTNAPLQLFAADFNNDARQDIFFYTSDTNGTLMLGNGSGGFSSTIAVSNGPIAVADFNNDGKMDFVTRGVAPDSITVFLGNGNGTFGTGKDASINGYAANIAALGYFNRPRDFNGDGKIDLAVVNSTLGCISVLLGKGDGTFGTATNYFVSSPTWAAIDDFNGDAKLDLCVASDNPAGSVNLLLGYGDGSFTEPIEYFSTTTNGFVTTGDVNGDRRSDLVVIDKFQSSFSLFLNQSLPELGYKRQTNKLVLNWPRWTGFQLQSAASSNGTWTNVTATPGTDFATQQYLLTNAISRTNQFFRLRK
jgi:hypothetical protein